MKSEISRRKFLKGSLAGAVGLAGLGMVPALAEETGTFADTIAWDGEYDVVVVGFGGSGANACYAAAKEGANVLAVDVAPLGHEGGNFRLAGQGFLEYTDYDSAYSYTKGLFGGFDVDEEMMKVWCENVIRTRSILGDMGADVSKFVDCEVFGYHPEFPFAGADNRYEYLMHYGKSDAYLWRFIRNCCAALSDKIDLWLSTPAKRLIQAADTKTILGVQVEHEGKLLNIRAKNGVVLCSGGFESNPDMTKQYLGIQKGVSMATPYNKGDGVKMAQEVGADMVHMWAYDGVTGPYGSAIPVINEDELVTTNSMFNNTVMKSGAVMAITKGGTRFVNETATSRHGKLGWGGGFYNARWAEESFIICDSAKFEEIKANGCLDAYLDRFVSGDTVEALAANIGVDAAALQATIDDFATFIDMGKDYLAGRDVATMGKFGVGPYYALEIEPGFHATRGGPRKNAKMEILDTDGNPIPHLYGAGELGSFYAHLREAAAGLTECIIFGQIAGRNAAAPKDALPLYDGGKMVASNIIYTIGSSKSDLVAEELVVETDEDEYVGVSDKGMGGVIGVKIRVKDGKLTSVEVVKQTETEQIAGPAFESLVQQALEKNSCELDAVSGATVTSNAFMEALRDAMTKAKML